MKGINVHFIREDGFHDGNGMMDEEEASKRQDVITIDPPSGLYWPRWIEDKWIEGLTQKEIDAIKNAPIPPNAVEEQMNEMQGNLDQAVVELTTLIAMQQGG